jgi:predicted AlkP superfamily phosphohydrolase/phosphomutase
VLSSDHGAAPLNQEVRLNNLFAKQGWLKFHYDAETQMHEIDWDKTKVVYLNMNHIYVNPRGLAGPYRPTSGPAYEALCEKVLALLKELKNQDGARPLAAVIRRSQAATWGLPEDRVGDLVLANELGFSWAEDVSDDLQVFVAALKAGYKQAILPDKEPALWTPFIIVGPGVKKGHAISRPISHLEQLPTLLKLLKINPPYTPDREPLAEVFTGGGK